MAYSIDQANMLSKQLGKFTTAYAHHLVGQFANVDFWLDEANHALAVMENYNKRFTRMREAQKTWVEAHNTVVSGFCRICRGKCEFDPRRPEPPTRCWPPRCLTRNQGRIPVLLGRAGSRAGVSCAGERSRA